MTGGTEGKAGGRMWPEGGVWGLERVFLGEMRAY